MTLGMGDRSWTVWPAGHFSDHPRTHEVPAGSLVYRVSSKYT